MEAKTEEMLLKASSNLQRGFIEKQAGFIRRELVKKSTNEYVDIVYWDNLENAHKAVENAMKSPACLAFFELMDEADVNDASGGVTYFEMINEY